MSDGVSRRIFAAVALHGVATLRDLAAELHRCGLPMLVLKGPLLQQRLYGTPAAYASVDVDVLVHPQDAGRVRRMLTAQGWRFQMENMLLWRLSRTCVFDRNGVVLDLHWGLHTGNLPSVFLRRLEQALWQGATPGDHGLYEPVPEALVVYLAVHAAGHDFARPEWADTVTKAAELVDDWDRVWRIARDCRVQSVLRRALAVAKGSSETTGPPMDGWRGRLDAVFWVLRGHFLPEDTRAAIGQTVGRVSGRGSTVNQFAGLDLVVRTGVWPPVPASERLVSLTLEAIAEASRPVVFDVGTGSGAVALSVARHRPDAEVIGVDISPKAVACARANARRLGIGNARFVRGDLLRPLQGRRAEVVVANIPHVIPGTTAPAGVTREMVEGGGFDGLHLLRRLAVQARELLAPGGSLVMQLAEAQWDGFASELDDLGYLPQLPRERRASGALFGTALVPEVVK